MSEIFGDLRTWFVMPERSDDVETREVEDLLRRVRPEPDHDVIERLERQLLGRQRRTRRWAAPRAAGALVGAGAAAVLAASLFGGGPLALRGDSSVEAEQNCRSVQRVVTAPVGELVEREDEPQVAARKRPVTTTVQVCR